MQVLSCVWCVPMHAVDETNPEAPNFYSKLAAPSPVALVDVDVTQRPTAPSGDPPG